MTYVTDQTSAQLRAHMKRLKVMSGWNEPLADRLYAEIVTMDSEIDELKQIIEQRNAMLSRDNADFMQAITDPENQPSQFGTVTLAMYDTLRTQNQALVDALELAMDNLRPHGDNCFLHDEGEYNSCFCGKDGLVNHFQSLVEQSFIAQAEGGV